MSFWDFVEKTETCWLWRGYCTPTGYGRFRKSSAHRFSYQEHKGSIPDGLQIDHLCKVKNCVNPDHLEAVTQAENIRRSDSASSLNSRKDACPKGHPYDGSNTYARSNRNHRECRECRIIRAREFRRQNRAAISERRRYLRLQKIDAIRNREGRHE